jgi:hypothetical protein
MSDKLKEAAAALIADVRRRHPGEELKCPYMQALDAAAAEGGWWRLLELCRRLASQSYAEPGAWESEPIIGRAVVYVDRELVKEIVAAAKVLPPAPKGERGT